MVGRIEQICQICGSNVGFSRSDDGHFYCGYCNSQADDIFDTGVDEEQYYSAIGSRARPANAAVAAAEAEPVSQVKLVASQYLDHPDIVVGDVENTMGDGSEPTGPSDFGSSQKTFKYDEYYSEIRSRYLHGLQVMINLQCQALVEKFNVSPLIIGLVGPLWLRFVASTRILSDEWANRAFHDSEVQTEVKSRSSADYKGEPVNIHGARVVYVWYRSLRRSLSISCPLAISFLVCHIARESIMPSDILKWTLEGKIPYFSALGEIEKQLGPRSDVCPIRDSLMFRPVRAISSQTLEFMAADIALRIGLDLPPVNFYAIASRYCKQLCLPEMQVLPLARRICEWVVPSELYLSANLFRIPTRACVMSVLIVTMRILFNINGFGIWESSLPHHSCSLSRMKNKLSKEEDDQDLCRLTLVELLKNLDEKYNERDDLHGNKYSSDLQSYLQYCKDIVFNGLWPLYDDPESESLINEFRDLYQNSKAGGTSDQAENLLKKRPRDPTESVQEEEKIMKTLGGQSACTDHESICYHCEATRKLKLDMEDNVFCYIPPRVKVKRKDYLHYARRRKNVYLYAVHADYYILLRLCAKVAQVETRIMHTAVLSFERRLEWLEKRIESSLNVNLDVD